MIQSAAIIKTKNRAPWREMRLQKRKDKKAAALERKANKVCFPSPINVRHDEPKDDAAPTREEMLQQAELMGLKVDKRWSDVTLLKQIEESSCLTQNDNS